MPRIVVILRVSVIWVHRRKRERYQRLLDPGYHAPAPGHHFIPASRTTVESSAMIDPW